MKKLAFMFLIVFLGTCFSLLAATPFTEDAVKPDDSTNVATGDKNTKVDDKFPVAGTIEAGSRLRLRSWPWGVVLGLFEPGSSVTVTGVSGEFYQVEIDGKKGYMHKNYISIPGAPASQEEPYYPGDTRNGGPPPMKVQKTSPAPAQVALQVRAQPLIPVPSRATRAASFHPQNSQESSARSPAKICAEPACPLP